VGPGLPLARVKLYYAQTQKDLRLAWILFFVFFIKKALNFLTN
jgi:hypothetical protein